jgi:uncharacterized protein YdaU (DUF1376 family)
MSINLDWFPFFWRDFDEATREMTNEEVGAYWRLLFYQWQYGSIPADMERAARITGERFGEKTGAMLLKKFLSAEGLPPDRLVNPRMAEIRAEQEAKYERRSNAGRKAGDYGAAKKWGKAGPSPEGKAKGRASRAQRLAEARAKGRHAEHEWQALIVACGSKCVKCRSDKWRLVKDHITPIRDGGSDGIENIQPLCWRCNSAKVGGDIEDFRPSDWRERVAAIAQTLSETPRTEHDERHGDSSGIKAKTHGESHEETHSVEPTRVKKEEENKEKREGRAKPKEKTARSRRAPPSLKVTDEHIAWARTEFPGIEINALGEWLRREMVKLKDHEFKNPYGDWDAVFRNWLRKSHEQGYSPAPKAGTAEDEKRRRALLQRAAELKLARAQEESWDAFAQRIREASEKAYERIRERARSAPPGVPGATSRKAVGE